MLFQNWSGIARTLLVGIMAYGALVLLLRVSGKRTLAKLNAFDLVVTVALGSTLATILLSESVSLAEGLTALSLLIFLQYAVAFTSVRSAGFAHAVRSEPTLLVHKGEALPQALKRERATLEEVESAVRSNGGQALAQAESVVLESDGSLSVILKA